MIEVSGGEREIEIERQRREKEYKQGNIQIVNDLEFSTITDRYQLLALGSPNIKNTSRYIVKHNTKDKKKILKEKQDKIISNKN